MVLQRAVKVSLQWLGPRDRRRLAALLQAYRAAVNFFVRLLWREPGLGFTTATSKRLARTRLSSRYRDQALKQAIELVSGTRKSAAALGVTPGRPFFRGAAVLDKKFVPRFEAGEGEHDLVVHLACLDKGAPLRLRTKRTKPLKKWLAMPGARLVPQSSGGATSVEARPAVGRAGSERARGLMASEASLVEGCALGDGDLLTLWVEVPAPELRTEGTVLGVDVGVRHLLATSDGMFLGSDFRDARDAVRRKKPGSKARRRARRTRDDLVCAAVKRLPWDDLQAVAFEELAGIKRGKRPGQGKRLRRALAAWRPPLVRQRLHALAAEHGVLAVPVPPAWTSTTCPKCNHRSAANRAGSAFRCARCGHLDDADHVGALNVQTRGQWALPDRLQAEREARVAAATKREERKVRAKRRGERNAEKRRLEREAMAQAAAPAAKEETTTTSSQDASSRGAQSPAARTPRESAPVRDQASGGAPYENAEGGHSRGRRKAAGRHGERSPPTRGPSAPRENCQVRRSQ